MGKFIRWPGLIAFVVVLGLLVGTTWLFANPLVKRLIESQGTALAGAKVEVGKVKLSLHPAGLVISQLDITASDNPMQNAVSIDKITAHFDLVKAFMGQLLIYDAQLEGVEFDTPRTTSGALRKQAPQPVQPAPPQQPSLAQQQLAKLNNQLPKANELLEREPLVTDERKNTLEHSYKTKHAAWQQLQQQLPDTNKLAHYEQQLKKITTTEINSLADLQRLEQELQQLKQAIRSDRDLLQQAKDQLQAAGQELADQLQQLKAAPKEDRDRILSKYTLDESGLVNMSGLIFGEEVSSKLATALLWYGRLAPYLASASPQDTQPEATQRQRSTGRFVRFAEFSPRPDFLLERLGATARLAAGELSIQAQDITHQQDVINRPTRLQITSTLLHNLENLDVQAVMDYRSNAGYSRADFNLQRLKIQDFHISGSSDFPLSLRKAQGDLTGYLHLDSSQINGNLEGEFTQASFQTATASGLLGLLSQAFASLNQFDLQVKLSGNLNQPQFSLKSNLDNKLKDSVEQQVKAQIAALRHDLEQQLSQRLNSYLQEFNLAEFSANEKSLNEQLTSLDTLLEAKLDDFKEQKKQQVQDKAKDSLKQELRRLF